MADAAVTLPADQWADVLYALARFTFAEGGQGYLSRTRADVLLREIDRQVEGSRA
jgi:hypothetical protein